MRLNLIGLILLTAGLSQAVASDQRRPSGPPTSTYVGPGDIAAFHAFWGLRACSSAAAGNKAINLRRASDGATIDIKTIASTGALDVATITDFLTHPTVTTGTITQFYDQSGHDLVQTVVANQATISLAPLKSVFNGRSTQYESVTGFSQVQPFAMLTVFSFNPVTAATSTFMSTSGSRQHMMVYNNQSAAGWSNFLGFDANGNKSAMVFHR